MASPGININYNKSVDIERLIEVESGDDGYEEYSEHLLNVDCHIQPLDESFSEDVDGSFGKDYLMFCDFADIQEGDRVIDGDIKYRVVGVRKFDFLNEERHIEVRIRIFND